MAVAHPSEGLRTARGIGRSPSADNIAEGGGPLRDADPDLAPAAMRAAAPARGLRDAVQGRRCGTTRDHPGARPPTGIPSLASPNPVE
ncbi:hypothetical protein [Intrasporangium mesophilum]